MIGEEHKEVIFIYNADKGIVNGLIDSMHKLLAPNSYECELCSITHGFVGPNREWTTFINKISLPIVFYHKNDLPRDFKQYKLPIILLKDGNGLQTIMNKEEMSRIQSIDELIDSFRSKLNAFK